MLQYLSASIVYPVAGAPLQNAVLVIEADGSIQAILTADEAKAQGVTAIRFYEGAIVPGLVNTHCHLELSHLFGEIPEHTGLQAFVQQVIKKRGASAEVVEEAMKQADLEMYRNGIVAVGDISNLPVSRNVKLQSQLYYHSFVEALGFDPEKAGSVMAGAKKVQAAFAPLKASIVPHAPYSVSKELFAEIRDYTAAHENLISMHNQETVDENRFFEEKKGAFLDFYKFLGLDISFFDAQGKSSLQSVLPELPPEKVLLVHNTLTNEADISFAKAHHENLYWCLCPNANLYIEQALPQLGLLRAEGLKLTLGTDSLASNHQLSILSEMITLQQAFPAGEQDPDFEELLTWATLNGAQFLGIDKTYGSLEPGKKPGINLIEGMEGQRLTPGTTIRRLI